MPSGASGSPVASVRERVYGLVRSNAALYLLGTIVARIGGIVLIPVYTRRLPLADYGEYALALTLLQLFPTFTSLGLTAGISRTFFDAPDREQGTRALGSVARGLLVITAVLHGLLAIGMWLFAPDVLFGLARHRWLYVIAASVGIAARTVPELFFRVQQRPRSAVVLQFGTFVLNAGLGIAFVLGLGRGLDGALEANAIGSLAIGAFAVGFILWLPSGNVYAETRQAIGFSLPFVPHYLASWFQLTADRWVLSAFSSPAALGTYYLAIQVLSPVSTLTSAVNEAETPRLGEIYREGGDTGAYRALPRQCRTYFLSAFIPAVLVVLGSPLVAFVIGPKFVGALAVIPALALMLVVDTFYYPLTTYLFFSGRTRQIPIITVSSAIVGIGLAIVLLPRFGLPGLLFSRVIGSACRSGSALFSAWRARPRAA